MTQSENSKSGQVTAAVIAGVFLTIGACITGAFLVFNTLVDKGAIIIVPSPMPIVSIQPSQISPNNPIATELSPTFTPTPDLWQFYVDDIKSTIPSAPVTADTLKEISYKIPLSVPFLAEAEVGLIPYQYTWSILNTEAPFSLNAPEGGYAYIAWGYGDIETDQFSFNFQAIEDNPYIILAIGKPDDDVSKDLNTPLRLSNFHAGFSGINFAIPAPEQVVPNREVVNKAWLSQQLWWASSHRQITESILDLLTGNRYDYDVNPSTFRWNIK